MSRRRRVQGAPRPSFSCGRGLHRYCTGADREARDLGHGWPVLVDVRCTCPCHREHAQVPGQLALI